MPIFMGRYMNINEIDIIDRLNDDIMYIDAVDDAITEIQKLRGRVAELEATQQGVQADNNRRAEFWACPQCDDIHGVEVSKCGCGYCR